MRVGRVTTERMPILNMVPPEILGWVVRRSPGAAPGFHALAATWRPGTDPKAAPWVEVDGEHPRRSQLRDALLTDRAAAEKAAAEVGGAVYFFARREGGFDLVPLSAPLPVPPGLLTAPDASPDA